MNIQFLQLQSIHAPTIAFHTKDKNCKLFQLFQYFLAYTRVGDFHHIIVAKLLVSRIHMEDGAWLSVLPPHTSLVLALSIFLQ